MSVVISSMPHCSYTQKSAFQKLYHCLEQYCHQYRCYYICVSQSLCFLVCNRGGKFWLIFQSTFHGSCSTSIETTISLFSFIMRFHLSRIILGESYCIQFFTQHQFLQFIQVFCSYYPFDMVATLHFIIWVHRKYPLYILWLSWFVLGGSMVKMML